MDKIAMSKTDEIDINQSIGFPGTENRPIDDVA